MRCVAGLLVTTAIWLFLGSRDCFTSMIWDAIGFVTLWSCSTVLLAGIAMARRSPWWRRILEIGAAAFGGFVLSVAGMYVAWSLAASAAEDDLRTMFRSASPDGPAERFRMEYEWDNSIAAASSEIEVEFTDITPGGGHEYIVRLSDGRHYSIEMYRENLWGAWRVYMNRWTPRE